MFCDLLVYCLVILTAGILTRVLYLTSIQRGEVLKSRVEPAKTLIILGSGGHTTEILRIVKHLDLSKYTPRCYIHAQTDEMSPVKLKDIERDENDFKTIPIPRSREVGQSYLTSIATTLIAFLHAVHLLISENPDLILCNGPGTGVPICLGAFILKTFFLSNSKIIFIESFCRVKSYSLTGKILYFFADHIIVQWPELYRKNSKYLHLIE